MKLGVEFELQIVSKATLELADVVEAVVGGTSLPPAVAHYPDVTHDVHACCLELRSAPVDTAAEAVEQLKAVGLSALSLLQPLDCTLAGGGLHPFSSRVGRRLIENARYDRLRRARGAAWEEAVTFGMHVHVESQGDLFSQVRRLRKLVPLLVAISGNSEPHGAGSARMAIYDKVATTGLPPRDLTESTFCAFVESHGNEAVREEKDVYWDVRPRPRFGTIEFRVFDAPKCWEAVERIAAVAAEAVERDSFPLFDEQTESELVHNRAMAIRFGLNALFDFAGKRIRAYDAISECCRDSSIAASVALFEKANVLSIAESIGVLW